MDKLPAKNYKLLAFCLISAFFLWVFVMYNEDPVDTRTVTKLPIQITNMDEIEGKNLALSIGQNLTADLEVMGKRTLVNSKLKDILTLEATIENPVLGKNIAKVDIVGDLDQLQVNLNPQHIEVNLEELATKTFKIQVSVSGEAAEDVGIIETKPNPETVYVQGPKSQVDKISKVVADINLTASSHNFSKLVDLKFLDSNNTEVVGVISNETSTLVNVELEKTKTVPINPVFKNSTYTLGSDFDVSHNQVEIKGSPELIDSITGIQTEKIDQQRLENTGVISAELVAPEGVSLSNSSIIIRSKNIARDENIDGIESLEFAAKELEIIGEHTLEDGTDLKDVLQIPSKITAKVSYTTDVDIAPRYAEKANYKIVVDISKYTPEKTTLPITLITNLDTNQTSLSPNYVGIIFPQPAPPEGNAEEALPDEKLDENI